MTIYRLAVLGDPVEHSRSPILHETMLDLAGLQGSYERIRADRIVLNRLVTGLREGEWHGFNVTMPLKEAAAEVADDLSPPAQRSRSVNTLLVDQGRVGGHSTDSTAFRALLGHDRFVNHGTILIIGSGGSAAAALAAIDRGRRVYVSARRAERAEMLTSTFGADPVAWGAGVAGALVINATPIGMGGESLPEGILEASSGLIDLPYGDAATPAIRWAERTGTPHVDGHEFLIRQAIESFRLWTGVEIRYSRLTDALRNV